LPPLEIVTFNPGDRVHVPLLGTGTVLTLRNGGRYLIEVKGRSVLVAGDQLQPAGPPRRRRGRRKTVARGNVSTAAAAGRAGVLSLDLHGKTVLEALEALDTFLNDALLAGADQARVIHGRSGDRLKAAVHERLAQLPSVRTFRLDPGNAGVTIAIL
jgi:DNA mismatch repair protein MutS2